ncbi:MAG: hypothetical protein GY737_00265 [Desulfobacteraceae bacterium]|nr:hypothetical protein [Desulfobacteraceae bacterium]
MGGSDGGSSESKPPDPSFLNPIGGVIGGLFGLKTKVKDGGLQFTGSAPNFASRQFGKESFADVDDFLRQLNQFAPEATAFGESVIGGLGETLSTFDNDVFPALQSALSGTPVDTSAAVSSAFTDVKEQLTPGTGLFSSDLAAAGQRQAAQLKIGAEEAARQRQLDAIPLAGLVGQARTQLPIQAGQGLLGLGEDINLTGTAAGRQVAGLQLFAGLQPTGAIPRGNISEQEQPGSKGL